MLLMHLLVCGGLLFGTLLNCGRAVPIKAISCMSYLEHDRSGGGGGSQQQYDDDGYGGDSEESDSAGLDATALDDGGGGGGVVVQATPFRRLCPADYTFCFALWRQPLATLTPEGLLITPPPRIEKQGCWKESNADRGVTTCREEACSSAAPTSSNTTLYYCCCAGDGCNDNVRVAATPPTPHASQLSPADAAAAAAATNNLNQDEALAATSRGRGSSPMTARMPLWLTLLLSVLGLLAGLTLTTALLYHWRRQTHAKATAAAAAAAGCHGGIMAALDDSCDAGGGGGGGPAPAGPGYSSNLRNVDNISLVGMVGRGKYGTVWQGRLHGRPVAVKIFPEAHEAYYRNERSIYALPMMADCPALLGYLGYDERRTLEGRIEYQLVLALAPLGCLQDWLIAHVVDAEAFARITRSVTRGLSHLHTEVRRAGVLVKPCVAHRDLNTRNILLKADRSCCIADFGFALKVFGGRYEYRGEVAAAETRSINEVGTLRYMAPELLEGAVNLRDCETSLKQMDVYALGLVLWEVAARCDDFYAMSGRALAAGQNPNPVGVPPAYRAPYEAEVGAHPSFDQMQALVVRHKARPLFPAGWGLGGEAGLSAAKLVRDTCEDCWDHDAEARLTALCAEERMHEVAALRRPPHNHPASPLPQLSANNNLSGGERSTPPSPQQVPTTTTTTGTPPPPVDGERSSTGAADEVAVFNPPPNQQVPATPTPTPGTEKNHLLGAAQQQHHHQLQAPLQPHHGRNPCLERNLAPIAVRRPPVLVERSQKHSFRHGGGGGIGGGSEEHSGFSCLDDDVSVEELIAGGAAAAAASRLMGEGFPKQQNADRKLRGWHGVRALIQKKLFGRNAADAAKAEGGGGVANPVNHSGVVGRPTYGDEKSNLVDKRYVESAGAGAALLADRRMLAGGSRRPNNLDLSPLNSAAPANNEPLKSNHIHSIAEEAAAPASAGRDGVVLRRSSARRVGTPSHVVVPRSLSATLIQQANNYNSQNNNNNNSNPLSLSPAYICAADERPDCVAPPPTTTTERSAMLRSQQSSQHRRQRSLDLFHEVFSGGQQRGSAERLRDPSQRVKTPGDVPPSVRRVRAAKTLSLYDDRMMMGALAALSEQELLQQQERHNQIL